MVVVRIAETYDLRTAVNKLGLLGIHTPSSSLLSRLYPGLMLNYKYLKLLKCDFAIACASTLPADPLSVGTESGDIAPQDLFNPILYKAVSNDALETIINRLYASDLNPISLGQDGSVTAAATVGNSPFSGYANTSNMYYSLLSEDNWKKAMPQSGFAMKNLVPLVYNMVNTFGNTIIPASAQSLNNIRGVTSAGATELNTSLGKTFRGHTMAMPRIPTCTQLITATDSAVNLPTWTAIPKTFVAAIVVPPAKQHILFYRLRVVWTIEFQDPVSIPARSDLVGINNVGAYMYSDWTTVGTKLGDLDGGKEESTVDTVDVDAEQIMQA